MRLKRIGLILALVVSAVIACGVEPDAPGAAPASDATATPSVSETLLATPTPRNPAEAADQAANQIAVVTRGPVECDSEVDLEPSSDRAKGTRVYELADGSSLCLRGSDANAEIAFELPVDAKLTYVLGLLRTGAGSRPENAVQKLPEPTREPSADEYLARCDELLAILDSGDEVKAGASEREGPDGTVIFALTDGRKLEERADGTLALSDVDGLTVTKGPDGALHCERQAVVR